MVFQHGLSATHIQNAKHAYRNHFWLWFLDFGILLSVSNTFSTNPWQPCNKWRRNQDVEVINHRSSLTDLSTYRWRLLWPPYSPSAAMHFWADSVTGQYKDKSQITAVRKQGCFQPCYVPFACVSSHLSTELHHDTVQVSWATPAPPDKTWMLRRLMAHRKKWWLQLIWSNAKLLSCWSKLTPLSRRGIFSQKLQVKGNFNNCRTNVGKIITNKQEDILT